ncbi:hypothetical protein D9M73_220390 [compost metagenome]
MQVVKQFGELVGIAFQRCVGGRYAALTVAEHVVGDDAVVVGQANELTAPHFLVQAHAVDQDHGLALADIQIAGAGRCAFSDRLNHGGRSLKVGRGG